MSEDDYIISTNLAKARIAITVVHDILALTPADEVIRSEVLCSLERLKNHYFNLVDVKEHEDA